MGGSTVVVAKATDPGFMVYTQKTTGRKFTCCVCVGAWVPVFEDYCLFRGHIKYSLDIIQLTGGDPDSANTHAQGAAIDTEQVGSAFIADARECGATGAWSRYPPAFDNDHSHLVLNGCPHDEHCHYQLVAQKDGYNGLGYLGRRGPDPYPDPSVYRTWEQGIAFMKSEMGQLTMADATSLENQIKALSSAVSSVSSAVSGFRAEEKGRYVVDTNRYKDLASRLTAVEAVLRGDTNVDEFKAAAFEAFDAALKSNVEVSITSKDT